MRILSLQPEIDPRAYKINTTLAEMYPDVEIVTLFGDECHYLNQRSKAAILGSFVPEKHYFAVNKWSIPKESFIKFYAPATETYARFVAGKIKRFVKAHNVDIIHARPPPDFLGYAAKRYTSYPVVSEIYDMMSLTGHHMNTRAKGVREGLFKFRNNMRADKMEKWESYIAEHSDYFVIPYQGIAHILSRRQKLAPTLFVPNAVPKSQITQQRMEKLSAKTGKLHLVHVGGIDIPPIASAKYRAIFPLLEKISKMGFHVHLYATATPEKSKTMKTICDKSNTLHWHDPVPPPQLYKELTQYDAGLIMVRDDPKHNQHMGISLPNRLFEYLSAGLFVVSSSRLKAVNAFTNPQGWGAEIRSVDEVASLSADIKPIPWDDRFCLEYYLKDLRKAYDTLV